MTSRADRQKREIFDSLRLTDAVRSDSGALYLIDGRWHRKRRGRLVPIPDGWLGKTADRRPYKRQPGLHDVPKKHRKWSTDRYTYTGKRKLWRGSHLRAMRLDGQPRRAWNGQEDT